MLLSWPSPTLTALQNVRLAAKPCNGTEEEEREPGFLGGELGTGKTRAFGRRVQLWFAKPPSPSPFFKKQGRIRRKKHKLRGGKLCGGIHS